MTCPILRPEKDVRAKTTSPEKLSSCEGSAILELDDGTSKETPPCDFCYGFCLISLRIVPLDVGDRMGKTPGKFGGEEHEAIVCRKAAVQDSVVCDSELHQGVSKGM
jgi:hypothetical protein